jgi:1-acyl-sn-glycerol-3-phosphate acyltransferase
MSSGVDATGAAMRLRPILLNTALYASLIVWMIAALPTLVLPRGVLMAVVRAWGRYFIALCRIVGGMDVDFRGRDRIPEGPLLVASKHQSLWETFALLAIFRDPCFVLKRELTYIPIFGWYAIKARQLPLDRRGGAAVLKALNARAREEVRRDGGRQLLFFPEGTRRPPGAEPAYRFGIAHVYEAVDVPCLPVALNAGLFWPRRSVNHRQGTILVEFMEPIPPGLPRDVFFARLQEEIEGGSSALLRESLAGLGDKAPRADLLKAGR